MFGFRLLYGRFLGMRTMTTPTIMVVRIIAAIAGRKYWSTIEVGVPLVPVGAGVAASLA